MIDRSSVHAAGAVVLVMLTMAGIVASRADQWPAPQTREVWSQSRDYFVRVIPGTGIGETVGFRGAPTGLPRPPSCTGGRVTVRIARPGRSAS